MPRIKHIAEKDNKSFINITEQGLFRKEKEKKKKKVKMSFELESRYQQSCTRKTPEACSNQTVCKLFSWMALSVKKSSRSSFRMQSASLIWCQHQIQNCNHLLKSHMPVAFCDAQNVYITKLDYISHKGTLTGPATI